MYATDVETPKAPSPMDSKRRKSVEDVSFAFYRAEPEGLEEIRSAFASPGERVEVPAARSPLDLLSPDAMSNPVTPGQLMIFE